MTSTRATPDLKLSLRAELERIEEDCVHSGKAHFNAGDLWARYHYWLGIPSVVLSALAGAALFTNEAGRPGFAISPKPTITNQF